MYSRLGQFLVGRPAPELRQCLRPLLFQTIRQTMDHVQKLHKLKKRRRKSFWCKERLIEAVVQTPNFLLPKAIAECKFIR